MHLDSERVGGREKERGRKRKKEGERLSDFQKIWRLRWQKDLLDLPFQCWFVGKEPLQGHKLKCPQDQVRVQ